MGWLKRLSLSCEARTVALVDPSVMSTLRGLAEQQERHDWMMAEYASLRQESVAAQANQQAALNWGLAVVSGGLVGGFALSAREGSPPLIVQSIQLVLFGLILPVLLLGISQVWLGEVQRMMRTGAYLRDLEAYLAEAGVARSPLGWELSLSGVQDRLPKQARRNRIGYLGAGMILAGGQISSGIIWSTMQAEYRLTISGLPVWCSWVGVWVLVIASLVLELWMATRVVNLGKISSS